MKKAYPIRLDYYQYCVETWIEIFKQIDFLKVETVVDLCLGWAPKIELALLKTGFKGKLYAVDKSQDNLKAFLSLIDPFEKQFQIATKKIDILKRNNLLNIKGDIIIANHIIDDLILNYYLEKKGLKEDELFSNLNLFKNIWKEIYENKSVFNEVKFIFKKMLINITKKGGLVIIAQYSGYQERLYHLDKTSIICKSLMRDLTNELIKSKLFISNTNLIENVFLNLKKPYFGKDEIICIKKI